MAVVTRQATPHDGSIDVVSWALTTSDLTGDPVTLPRSNDRTVSVTGLSGGDTVTWHGSLDPGDAPAYYPLHDYDGAVLTFTADGVAAVRENSYLLRPVRTGTAGGTITARVLFHRAAQF